MPTPTKAELKRAAEEAARLKEETAAKLAELTPAFQAAENAAVAASVAASQAARLARLRGYLTEARKLTPKARELLSLFYGGKCDFTAVENDAYDAYVELKKRRLVRTGDVWFRCPVLTERGKGFLEALREWGVE